VTDLVTKAHGGQTFLVVDPATYPYGNPTFDMDEPMHKHWAKFGAGHTVIDIGASFGSYALPALSRGARVIAVEPSDDGWRILGENLKANGWSDRCTCFKLVLYDGKTYYPDALRKDVFTRSYPSSSLIWVTLDELLDGVPVKIDAIKMDVEGGELGVLEGGLETLNRWHPMLFIEDHDNCAPGANEIVSDYPASINSSNRIHELLKSLGYSILVEPFMDHRKYIIAEAK
jgi:FkbM family methyltransferase